MNFMIKLSLLGLLVLCDGIEPCFSQPAQPEMGTNSPVCRLVKLFELKRDGAYVFTFCPATRDLFVSFSEEKSQVMYRWNLDAGRKMDAYKFPKKYRCDKAVISPDGKVLVLAAYDMLHDPLQRADKVRVIDVRSGKVIKELIYDGPPARIQFSRDGKFFMTFKFTYDSGGELVYDINGNEQKNLDLRAFDPIDTSFVWEIPNSKGGPEPGLFCRDAQGKRHKLYPTGDTYWSDMHGHVVSTDVRYVACSTGKGKLMIWRTSDAKLVFELQVGGGRFPLCYDSTTGRFLFADGDIDKMTWLQAVQLSTPN